MRFLGIILRVSRLEVFVYNVYITKPVSNHLCSRAQGGGGIKIFIEGTVNSKEENSSDFCLDFFLEFGLRRFVEKDQIFLNFS